MASGDIDISLNLVAIIAVIASSLGLAFTFRRELEQILEKAVLKLHLPIWGDRKTKPAPVSSRQCPNNPAHVLDPKWEICPYCKAEHETKQKSIRPIMAAASSGRERTAVGNVLPASEQRETKVMPSGATPQPSERSGRGDPRRIVGVVISYSWRPEGQLFPIREGRNFIGRTDISSEAVPRPCDIQILQDAKMSAEHALILCRQGNYEIIDQETTNGTFVNGELLKANLSADLPNYATIQTGGTEWTFIKIDAPQKAGEFVSAGSPPESPPRPTPRDPTPVR